MQVDCYKRNFESEVCTKKCKFYSECYREALKTLSKRKYKVVKDYYE